MSAAEETEEGTGAGAPARVRLQFSPSGIDVKVPGGVTVFDAASWNGIAIDSTCGGHGTCRKCKVQITEGEAPLSKLDSRAFTPDELRAGWRLACRVPRRAPCFTPAALLCLCPRPPRGRYCCCMARRTPPTPHRLAPAWPQGCAPAAPKRR